MSNVQPIATIGHNNPPSDIEVFGDKMKDLYSDTIGFAEKLLAAEERLPEVVNDDTDSGKLGDFIKQLKNCDKSLNGAREAEKEVYLKGTRMVDGYFNNIREKLKKIAEKAAKVQGEYLKRKEDEERRRREEEAEKKRQEMEEALREEKRKREEADAKRREAEEIDRKAREEAARREAAIKAKADEDKRRQQEEIDALRRDQEAKDKIAAEDRAKLRDAQDRLKEIERTEKADLKEVKQDVKASEELTHELNKQAKADERESNRFLDTALRADKAAEKLDKLADSSAADLARTRGLEGSLSTVKTGWIGTVTHRDQLDKAALWPHLKAEDLQIALNAWVKANPGQQMPGAYVREETTAVVR